MPVVPTTKQQRLKLHKVPFMTYLEPEQRSALQALSARTGVSQARYIRDAVTLILQQNAPVALPPVQSRDIPITSG